MKKLLLLLLPMFFSYLLFAQVEPANYKSASTRFQKFYNDHAVDSLYSCFSVAAKKVISPDKIAGLITQLQTGYGKLNTLQFISLTLPVASYKAGFEKSVMEMSLILDSENKIAGFYFKPYQEKANLTLSPGLTENPIEVKTADATLAGSIILPAKSSTAKVPVVLIIAGSGPTDRNGNSSLGISSNSYFLLADALGKAGIATLRYDKRAIGKSISKKNVNDVRF
ncbi:MAG: hypothetical protein EOP42_27640, partial [Sphingobacteriaceae bacterium]